MAKNKLTVHLSEKGMAELAKELEHYKKNTLRYKMKIFLDRLAENGITVASSLYDEYRNYVFFEKKVTFNNGNCTAIIVARKLSDVHREWFDKNGNVVGEADVNPLLMAEFGSGWKAVVRKGNSKSEYPLAAGVGGQGTFPNQEHAFDRQGWFWRDDKGELHHSYGEEPSAPMYNASVTMILTVKQIAKEVFG